MGYPMKAQATGMQSAILVALIGILITIYIVLLPDAERQDLLQGGPGVESAGNAGVILLDYPGRLDYLEGNVVEHNFPRMQLFNVVETTIFRELPSLVVGSSVFSKDIANMSFRVPLPNATESSSVIFTVKGGEGALFVEVNGQQIYSGSPTGTASPIAIPREVLTQSNELRFMVAKPSWWKFWKKNEYSLEQIKVIGEVRDLSSQESKGVFKITSYELVHTLNSYLRFTPSCNPKKVRDLKVSLNDKVVYNAVPSCGQLKIIDLNNSILLQENNVIHFKADGSDYILGSIAVVNELNQTPMREYEFQISAREFDQIRQGSLGVAMIFHFFEPEEIKEAEIYINERKTYLPRLEGPEYSRDITPYLRPGLNTLRIVPRASMDIQEFEIRFI